MIPNSKKPTVEIFYKIFSDKKYISKKSYCVESEFIPSFDVQIKTFEESVKQEQKEFILTTLKQIGAA